ncbi:MAG: nitroreductase family protein [Solirubrobacteraceae bacterium]|jgi:nitroreductase
MELFEVMRGAPATRRFRPDPVEHDVLERVLEAARFAPSGGNRQGWRVIAVTDAETRRALRDLYQPHWRAYFDHTGASEILANPGEHDAAHVRMLRRSDEFADRLHEVPLHLLVCVRIADMLITDGELDRPSIVGGASIYPFVQNVLLALRAEGLGATLTTLLIPAEPAVKRLLGIPAELALAAFIAAGHRADPWPSALRRRPVSDFAYAERYGQPF